MSEGQREEFAPDGRRSVVPAAPPTERWDRVSDAPTCASIAPDDGALMRRVAAGDREAFECLVVRHAARIDSICKRYVPPAVVADACQEVALQVWMAASTYRGEGSVAGWIAAIAHNKAVEIALKESSRRKRIVSGLGAGDDLRRPEEPGDFELVADRDLLTRVMASIERPEDRYVFWLVYVEGRDIAAVAAHLYLSTETVKSRIKRAKRRLRWLHGGAALA